MKHTHDTKVEVSLLDISTDIETVIDKVTDSAVTIIVALTASQIIKSYFTRGKHVLHYYRG